MINWQQKAVYLTTVLCESEIETIYYNNALPILDQFLGYVCNVIGKYQWQVCNVSLCVVIGKLTIRRKRLQAWIAHHSPVKSIYQCKWN